MIRTFLFLFSFVFSVFASNILTYNIYDRTDRVDVMLTFDTPYEGKIIKSTKNNAIILRLYDVKIESAKKKLIHSPFITSLLISPFEDYTEIVATIPKKNISIKASKTADGYGLRLRFTKYTPLQTTHKTQLQSQLKGSNPSSLPTQKSLEIPTSYYVVVTILFLLVVVMLFLKKKTQNSLTPKEGWLFAKKQQLPPQKEQQPMQQEENVTIRFQKQINENTSVIMLDFLDQSYLVLLGTNNNILLDKFIENRPTTQSEFEELLHQKHEELTHYLQEEDDLTSNEPKETLLKDFSKKASHIPLDLD